MSKEKSVAFLIPHYYASLDTTLLPIAKALRASYDIEPLFLIRYPEFIRSVELLKKHNMSYQIVDLGTENLHLSYQSDLSWLNPMRYLYSIKSVIRHKEQMMGIAQKLIDYYNPIGVFVVGESLQFEVFVIECANQRNIATVLVQWAFTAPREYYERCDRWERLNTKKQFRRLPLVLQPIAQLRFKFNKSIQKWIYRDIKIAQFIGDGNARYMTVFGEYHKELFSSQGVPLEKIHVTGHPQDDILFHLRTESDNPEYRARVCTELGLDAEKKIIILAREAIVHFELMSEKEDKDDLKFILKQICTMGDHYQVVLKLHLRDEASYYAFVTAELPKVKIIQYCDFYSLISICELFIAQISSTILWALALAKPVISYDFHGIHAPYIRSLAGIVHTDSRDEFYEILRKCLTNRVFKEQLVRDSQTTCDRYMKLDGHATERIIDLIVRR